MIFSDNKLGTDDSNILGYNDDEQLVPTLGDGGSSIIDQLGGLLAKTHQHT